MIALEMKDDGLGCSDAALTQVMQLFERAGKTAGTGVGLYLVHSLMAKMDGQANFENKNGFGGILHFENNGGGQVT